MVSSVCQLEHQDRIEMYWFESFTDVYYKSKWPALAITVGNPWNKNTSNSAWIWFKQSTTSLNASNSRVLYSWWLKTNPFKHIFFVPIVFFAKFQGKTTRNKQDILKPTPIVTMHSCWEPTNMFLRMANFWWKSCDLLFKFKQTTLPLTSFLHRFFDQQKDQKGSYVNHMLGACYIKPNHSKSIYSSDFAKTKNTCPSFFTSSTSKKNRLDFHRFKGGNQRVPPEFTTRQTSQSSWIWTHLSSNSFSSLGIDHPIGKHKRWHRVSDLGWENPWWFVCWLGI